MGTGTGYRVMVTGCRVRLLFEALQALIQVLVDLKYIVQLQELEQFHHLFINITDLEGSIIVIGGFHDGQKDTEPGAVDKLDAGKVKHQFDIGFVEVFQEAFFNRFGDW